MNPVKIDPVWLMHVQKPARYIGGEWNSIVKNHDSVYVKCNQFKILCFGRACICTMDRHGKDDA